MERFRQKTARLREYLRIVHEIRDDCERRFETDPVYRGALLYYLYLLADTCVSLAGIVIRLRKLRPPQSYHEAIDILGEAGVLEREFANRFARIAGFRNVLAHDYENLEAAAICREAIGRLDDVETYLRQLENHFSNGNSGD